MVYFQSRDIRVSDVPPCRYCENEMAKGYLDPLTRILDDLSSPGSYFHGMSALPHLCYRCIVKAIPNFTPGNDWPAEWTQNVPKYGIRSGIQTPEKTPVVHYDSGIVPIAYHDCTWRRYNLPKIGYIVGKGWAIVQDDSYILIRYCPYCGLSVKDNKY